MVPWSNSHRECAKSFWAGELALARRNEGFLDILAQMPWWVSVVVAAAVFVSLRFILPAMFGADSVAYILVTALSRNAALLAAVFLLPGVVSIVRSARKGRMLEAQTGIDSIRSLSWARFEELLAEAFKRQGYSVLENLYGGADGGIDLVIRKGRETYLVQCKQWRSAKVGVKVIREMLGLVVAHRAQGGIVVTSGTFTGEAEGFASKNPVYLIDGPRLREMIRSVQTRAVQPQSMAVAQVENARRCPRCGRDMVLREAQRGGRAGSKFWGCSGYPSCRYTEEYAG